MEDMFARPKKGPSTTELPKAEQVKIEKIMGPEKAIPVAPTALNTPPPVKNFQSTGKIPPHKRLKWIFFKPEHVSRKKWLIVNFCLLLLIGLAVLGGYKLYKYLTKTSPILNVAATKRVVKPKIEPSRLTGLPVDPSLNLRPVTGVMIENSPDARPQSGLTDAGVVVEAIAEGGITRFLALYQEAQPQYIGPVRSVRPYYLDFALAFNAGVAHVGGSPEALGQVRGLKVRDLDEFYNGGSYWRITSRYAPHNVYTSFAKLDALNKSKGYTSSTFDSWARKKDQPSQQPTASTINMAISGYYYDTAYKYDPKTNTYLRSEGGAPHIDLKSKKQISPKVLIALVMPYSIEADGKHSQYGTTGSGQAFVFQDGTVTKGTWHKASRSAQISFTDTNGQIIKINAGQTWITLLAHGYNLTYKP